LEDCPHPGFTVPELSGVIYRCNEYPNGRELFRNENIVDWYLVPTTQSTKIGRTTYFIQDDPCLFHDDPEGMEVELLCTLNSLEPKKIWPFVDLETLPADANEPDDHWEWGRYRMFLGANGCMYFMIDKNGEVAWACDCY
jgi:hypothetical protein